MLKLPFIDDLSPEGSGAGSLTKSTIDWLLSKSPSFMKDYLRPYEQLHLASIFHLVRDNYSSLDDLSFFEFGSRHYSFPSYPPFSSAISHLFSVAKVDYACFDPEVDRSLFVSASDHLRLFLETGNSLHLARFGRKHGDSSLVEKIGLLYWSRNKRHFLGLSSEKEFVDYLSNLIVDLDESAKSYEEMVSLISSSEKKLIFSTNVINYPESEDYVSFANKGLDHDFPFWTIEEGFHIHTASWSELLEKLGYSKTKAYYSSLEAPSSEQLSLFKEYFKIKSDVSYAVISAESYQEDMTLAFYWNADKK